MKGRHIACFFALCSAALACGQDSWGYKLNIGSTNGHPYNLDLNYRKAGVESYLKRSDLEILYRPIDFMLTNQQHLDGNSNITQIGFDFVLNELVQKLPARWRGFATDAIRFGLTVKQDDLRSRTFTRGKTSLDFKIEF